ncbi:MAG: DUF2341 domain-containing protein [Methylococcales bacterium]|nr:DUF2341 domain-containing protein [Methylococcales bacterium]
MRKLVISTLLIGLCFPLAATAWWNDDWHSRRQITLDAAVTGADIQETLTNVPVLLRLHAGNFGYFAELGDNGRDLRFLKNDQIALAHDIEKLDPFSEIGLVWVKLPEVRGGMSSDDFWLYYGNAHAADASDSHRVYDVAQSLVYHFKEGETLPQDATAYATHASASTVQVVAAGWIGAAAQFSGNSGIRVESVPQLAFKPDEGWTFSTWLKIDQAQDDATVLLAGDDSSGIRLSVRGTELSVNSLAGAAVPAVSLGLEQWRHVTVVVRPGDGEQAEQNLELYIDGALAGAVPVNLTAANYGLDIGQQLTGLLDEVQVAGTARSADWLKWAFRNQSPDFIVLNHGQDESNVSESVSYFPVIIQNVTSDGWVVMGMIGIMFVITLMVMVTKTLVINKVGKDNRAFLAAYANIAPQQLDALDQEETAEEQALGDSDLLTALAGHHDHFQSSPLYHLYHLGIRELKKLTGGAQANVSAEAWDYLRVKLDSAIVTESQKLNRNMVLLTLSISGGPFLGLLGTVLGVMITFAAIAATGDVNINSIAPGIAAALLTTVAGLAVAIPALFTYNYLLTQIKEMTATMRVFTDEFLAVLALGSTNRRNGG